MKPYCCFLAHTPVKILTLVLLMAFGFNDAFAQVRSLIAEPINEGKLVELQGNTPLALRDGIDLGAVDPSQPIGRAFLVLTRSAEQEADLQSFLQQVHQQASPHFHQWLTPAAFGQRFGVADSDLEQVKGWLQSHGLSVAKVSSGKTVMEFSGTAGQVESAFHTSIHSYSVKGVTHYSNATNPQIPSALAAVVGGVTQLNDFRPFPQSKVLGQTAFNPKNHQGTPTWTYPNGFGSANLYLLTPEDFATQYDAKSAYAAGTNGTGQTIGIINESNIDISLVNAYRKLFGLPANPPQVVIDGNDPGVNEYALEAYLDVENAGAAAPGATVKLYVAGTYGLTGGGVSFSLVRAVDDDVASVLSLSFGTCEENGTAFNQFINDEWEQAASQGQTVLVSTGDSGSFGCYGLDVNGFASTPWNMAVGGTDAYFSDYATGGASIAGYWSNVNDATLGSLQKPMPEQPWNGTIYGLNSTLYDPGSAGDSAGGGGASACAVGPGTFDPKTGLPICTAGYPKPSWQVGTGVPNDSVRDLPDISLFASNGYNGIAWPICAFPGDCTVDNPGTTSLLVTGVGGTSASTPAMAGIMALIDQKYGPQGQANYTLYPLAAQFPSTINAVDIGSNNIPCSKGNVGFELGCTANKGSTTVFSLQNYSAHTGYDQASGLGTVDVANLLANWGNITFKQSATNVAFTPATITHGQNVTATATVTGTGTPAGAVALVSSSTLPSYKGLTSIPLGAGGKGTAAINALPGGTYTIYGQYSGDGINGTSKSSATTITVAPESSITTLTAQYQNSNNYQIGPLPSGSTISYDNNVVLDVQVLGASLSPTASTYGEATGIVTFSDNGVVIGKSVLNAVGVAELAVYTIGIGPHSITASYAGDASYLASQTTPPFTFIVKKQTVAIEVYQDNSCTDSFVSGIGDVYNCIAGVPLVNTIFIASNGLYSGIATGTVTYQFGNQPPTTQTLLPYTLAFFGAVLPGSYIPAPLSNLPVGSNNLVVTYSGDTNFAPASVSIPFIIKKSSLLQSNVTLTLTNPANPASITPTTLLTFTATIAGNGSTAPTGAVTLYGMNVVALTNPVPIKSGANGTSSVSLQGLAADLQPGQNVLTATYGGDSIYQPSTSNILTGVNNDNTDFSLVNQSPSLVIASGSSGSTTINLASLNGFNGVVGLTCSVPSTFTCSLAPASVNLNGAGTTVLTLNAFTLTGKSDPGQFGRMTAPIFACLLLLFLPKRRRLGRVLYALLFCATLSAGIGCSGKSSIATGTSPGPAKTPAGAYTVVVTGVSSVGTIHNAAINVVIQ